MTKNKSTTAQSEPTNLLQEHYSEDPHFEFTLTWQEIAPVYQKTLSRSAKQIKHKGFRPGKVPQHLAEELIDSQYLIQEVLKPLLGSAYKQALAAQKHTPIDDPELIVKSAKKNQDWIIIAYLPQKPVIELPAYQKIISEQKKAITAKIKAAQKKAATDKKDQPKENEKLSEQEINNRSTDQALLHLLQEIKPRVSPILVKRAAQKEFERMLTQLQQHQISLEEYLQNIGSNQEDLGQQLMFSALQNLQMEFILDALITAEKISLTEEELLVKLTEVMPDVKTQKEKKSQLEQKEVRAYIELLAKRKKLADWLLSL